MTDIMIGSKHLVACGMFSTYTSTYTGSYDILHYHHHHHHLLLSILPYTKRNTHYHPSSIIPSHLYGIVDYHHNHNHYYYYYIIKILQQYKQYKQSCLLESYHSN